MYTMQSLVDMLTMCSMHAGGSWVKMNWMATSNIYKISLLPLNSFNSKTLHLQRLQPTSLTLASVSVYHNQSTALIIPLSSPINKKIWIVKSERQFRCLTCWANGNGSRIKKQSCPFTGSVGGHCISGRLRDQNQVSHYLKLALHSKEQDNGSPKGSLMF